MTQTTPAGARPARRGGMKAASATTRYRLAVASRGLAAILGGYGLASASAVCLALCLPLARSEAVIAGGMASFLVYVGAVLWAFACRSVLHAWLGIGAPALALAGIAWVRHGALS